jgi:DNA polymerase-1
MNSTERNIIHEVGKNICPIKFISSQKEITANDRYQIASTKDVLQFLKYVNSEICLDIETTGLNFLTDKLLLLQIGNQEFQWIIDCATTDITFLKEFLEDPKIVKIGHNLKFDYKFLKKAGITLNNIYDTMLVEQVLHTGKNSVDFGLSELCYRYMGFHLNKKVTQSFITHKISRGFTTDQIIYAAEDIKVLPYIKIQQEMELEQQKLKDVALLENRASLAFADIEFNGMKLDIARWKQLAEESAKTVIVLETELDKLLEQDKLFDKFRLKAIQTDMFTPFEDLRKINVKWSSPKQVLDVMQKMIPQLDSVGAPELERYGNKFPVIAKYLEFSQARKLHTSYGHKFLDHLYPDGKIHTDFYQILNTGRVSSSMPNMQQIPADNAYRNCFIPDNAEWVFVSADYASQELALIAHMSQDPVWLEALRNGEDLHSVCAELVFGDKWRNAAEPDCAYFAKDEESWVEHEEPFPHRELTVTIAKKKCDCPTHKKLRDAVKTINFGLAYGMGPDKLAMRLNISRDNASDLINDYFTVFPQIKASLERSASFGKTNGYIITLPPWRRKRWFPGWQGWKTDPAVMGSIEREAKNTPIQGAGADMVKLALSLIRKEIQEYALPVKLVMQVHDQIDTLSKVEYSLIWKNRMKELMEQAAKYTIPSGLLKAEVKITSNWEK